MTRFLSAAELDALIDTLDRAERPQTNIWRKPLFDLQEQLSKAQRIRRWLNWPTVGFALIAPGLGRTPEMMSWLGYSWVIAAMALIITQLVLQRLLPVLDREARIQALGSYFLPYRDYDDYENNNHGPKHDAA